MTKTIRQSLDLKKRMRKDNPKRRAEHTNKATDGEHKKPRISQCRTCVQFLKNTAPKSFTLSRSQ